MSHPPMRVLVLSSTFPNVRQPVLGIFIRERVQRIAHRCDLRVVAPIPWFPLNRLVRGARWAGIPGVEQQAGLPPVHHPRFFCVPRYGKWLDGMLYGASLVPAIAKLRRRFPFDLIDAHFAYPDGLAAVILGKVFRRPVVITLRGSIVRLSTYPSHRPQLRFALRNAAGVLAVSQSLKQVAVDLGIAPDKIRVIPNGVDTEQFQPRDRSAARAALGLPADRRILLSIGGLNEGKGHHRVVALLPQILPRYPDLLYVVVGGGRLADSTGPMIERLVARLGLASHVLLAGERPHREVPQWLAAADLFCLATRSEGWANVLLESIACGRPVVTTRVGGNPEIVTSDALGLLVPAADDGALRDAIVTALGRTWDEEAMAAQVRSRSWEAAATAVMEEFQRVVTASRHWSTNSEPWGVEPAPEP